MMTTIINVVLPSDVHIIIRYPKNKKSMKKRKKWLTLPRIFCPGGGYGFSPNPRTPPPAISVSVICDRIALIAHTFIREGLIWQHVQPNRTVESLVISFDSSRKPNWISISVTRMRFEPGFPGRVRFGITPRPNRICSPTHQRVSGRTRACATCQTLTKELWNTYTSPSLLDGVGSVTVVHCTRCLI